MAANEGVTKVIVSFYRVDLGVVFLGLSYYLRPNIIPANFFWVSRNVPATFADFRRLWKDFWTLPTMSAKKVSKTFEHFQSYFEDDDFNML